MRRDTRERNGSRSSRNRREPHEDWPEDYYESDPYRELDMRPRRNRSLNVPVGTILYWVALILALAWIDTTLRDTGTFPDGLLGIILSPFDAIRALGGS